MKKIERRAHLCLILAGFLLLGLCMFMFRFATRGEKWVSFTGNLHLYKGNAQLSVGRVLDRDGDVLSWTNDKGVRQYYNGRTVREATLHAVGDPNGKIGTSALVSFAHALSGYNLITGVYTPLGMGNDLTLTLDAKFNYAAYSALGGRRGTVGVYNYKTGEVLCMVSAPTFDPANPPKNVEEDARYEGVYINRFLSGTFVPGSVFKTVTLAAALEKVPNVTERQFTCSGSLRVGGDVITCPKVHGDMDLTQALVRSCNGVFAQLAAEMGGEVLTAYGEKAGLTRRYSVSGIQTAAGRLDLTAATENQLGWAGVGQYTTAVNPCALMVYMGAIGSGGKAAVPQLVLKTENSLGMNTSPYRQHNTTRLLSERTAQTMGEMMGEAVTQTYGTARFGGLDVRAKSGTAEVGGGRAPHAWFTGYLQDEAHPYAFVVLVENGGSGAAVAGNVAAAVLKAITK